MTAPSLISLAKLNLKKKYVMQKRKKEEITFVP
jgi:hypothetical protein